MKTTLAIFSLFFTITILVVQSVYQGGFSNVNGAPAGRTGSPGDGGLTCNISGCHTGPTPATMSGWITSNVPGSGYIPGNTYTITATATRPGHVRFGFEISPQSNTGMLLGTLQVTNATETQIVLVKYITHKLAGTTGSGSRTWSFNWIAPVAGTGNVTFYGTFNCANNSGSTFGDTIFKSTLIVPEGTTGISDAESDFSLNIYPVPASENIFIDLKLRNNQLPEIQLTDISGKVIRNISDAEISSAQELTYNVNTAGLDPGIYFVRLIQGSTVSVRKIVIL